MIKRRSLSLKVFSFNATLIILIIAVVLGILYFMLPSYYLREKGRILNKSANALEISLNKAATEEECAFLISTFAEANNSVILAFDNSGFFLPELSSVFLPVNERERQNFSVRFFTSTVGALGTNDKLEFPPGYSDDVRILDTKTDATFVFAQNRSSMSILKNLNNGLIGSITINSTLQPIDEAKSVIISLMPFLFFIAFVIALTASYIFAKKLTKPILKISQSAALMQEMRPDALSNVRTRDELGQLSYNLDSLYLKLCKNIKHLQTEMDKVTKLEQSKTDFIRAAGHELKTPIATINGMVEGMIDNVGVYKNHEKYLHECREQLLRLAKLVNEILMAAQSEKENSLLYEDAHIGEIVEESLSDYEVLINNKQLNVIRDDFEFIYKTNCHIFKSALSNIISNAVNYTIPGGKIIISFNGCTNESILSVENQCENVNPNMIPKLFEPFFTLDYSRDKAVSGTGLGLYITKKSLDALELDYKIENTQVGIKFSILFTNY